MVWEKGETITTHCQRSTVCIYTGSIKASPLVPSPGLACSECSPTGRPEPMSALVGLARAVVSPPPSPLSPVPALQPGWCCGAGCTIVSPTSVSVCTAECKAGITPITFFVYNRPTLYPTLRAQLPTMYSLSRLE